MLLYLLEPMEYEEHFLVKKKPWTSSEAWQNVRE